MSKVWLVTGANRGFGLEFCKAALAAGDRVIATCRKPADFAAADVQGGDNLLTLQLDVTDEAQAASVAKAGVARFGAIDVLINNAGYPLLGALEECTPDEIEAQFRTNVFGLIQVTNAVLPTMRKQRRGHIINLSSMAAIRGQAGSGPYSASKFAVEGLSEALADEVSPFGIKVTILQPGYFRTDLLSDTTLKFANREIDDYAANVGKMRKMISGVSGKQAGDPAKLAQAVKAIIASDNPPFRFALGPDAVAAAEEKIASWRAELDQWRKLSSSTDFN